MVQAQVKQVLSYERLNEGPSCITFCIAEFVLIKLMNKSVTKAVSVPYVPNVVVDVLELQLKLCVHSRYWERGVRYPVTAFSPFNEADHAAIHHPQHLLFIGSPVLDQKDVWERLDIEYFLKFLLFVGNDVCKAHLALVFVSQHAHHVHGILAHPKMILRSTFPHESDKPCLIRRVGSKEQLAIHIFIHLDSIKFLWPIFITFTALSLIKSVLIGHFKESSVYCVEPFFVKAVFRIEL